MKPVPIKDDSKGDLTVSDRALTLALYKSPNLTVYFDKGNKAEPSVKTDEKFVDSAGTYADADAFVAATLNCIKLTGINENAGHDVIVPASSFKSMETVTGGTRIYLGGNSSYPDYVEVSESEATIITDFETKRQAEITQV